MEFLSFGGFGKNIDSQIRKIVDETAVHGSAIDVYNVISMVERNNVRPYSHMTLKGIFSLDRKINENDL